MFGMSLGPSGREKMLGSYFNLYGICLPNAERRILRGLIRYVQLHVEENVILHPKI